MKSKILILFLCGLVAFSVFLEYRGSAATSECPDPPLRLCLPVTPPPCERPEVLPDCSVVRPLVRGKGEHRWRKHLIGETIRCPQGLCFVYEDDKLNTVARVSTRDILRAIGR